MLLAFFHSQTLTLIFGFYVYLNRGKWTTDKRFKDWMPQWPVLHLAEQG